MGFFEISKFSKKNPPPSSSTPYPVDSTLNILGVFGLLIKPLIRLLQPPCQKLQNSASSEPTTPLSLCSSLLENGQGGEGQQFLHRPSCLRMLLTKPTHIVHYYWRKFDDNFMSPAFGGRGFVPFVPGSPTGRSVHGWD